MLPINNISMRPVPPLHDRTVWTQNYPLRHELDLAGPHTCFISPHVIHVFRRPQCRCLDLCITRLSVDIDSNKGNAAFKQETLQRFRLGTLMQLVNI